MNLARRWDQRAHFCSRSPASSSGRTSGKRIRSCRRPAGKQAEPALGSKLPATDRRRFDGLTQLDVDDCVRVSVTSW